MYHTISNLLSFIIFKWYKKFWGRPVGMQMGMSGVPSEDVRDHLRLHWRLYRATPSPALNAMLIISSKVF